MIRRVVEPRDNALPVPSLNETHDEAGQPYTLERAFAYCERMARGHYENFPVASRFVPARLRPYVWAVYAFARSADDFADERATRAAAPRRSASGTTSSIAASTARRSTRCSSRCARPSSSATSRSSRSRTC